MSDVYKPGICFDFDGVIHSYTSAWEGIEVIPDAPVDGAFDCLEKMLDSGFDVSIFSTRSKYVEGLAAMKEWFGYYGFARLDELLFPTEKPLAMLYVDDRAFEFRGIFPTVDYVRRFKAWNK